MALSGALHVLLVDDEALVRLPLADALEEQGYEVIQAANSDEAWASLQAAERVDVLLLDIVMPGSMNGQQLAERVRQAYPDTKIVLTSGWDADMSAPLGAVISKPFQLEDLLSVLAELTGPHTRG